MQNLPYSSREYLNQRHRLSHQQIDVLLNEQYSKKNLKEKYGQLFQISEFIKITDAFQKSSIPFTPLKGLILSYRLHQDASYRHSFDLDLLVSIKDIEKCISILEQHGYKTLLFPWPDNFKKRKKLIRLSNQILLSNPKNNINIEIHWKLFKSRIVQDCILSDIINSNCKTIIFQNRSFQVFDNELELLYLIIHGGKHAWFRLKWLIDVKDFIEKVPIDSEKFSQLVLKLRASRMVSLCNATLSRYFPDCPSLPTAKPVRNTKKRLNFITKQIEDKEYYHKAFFEKINVFWFKMSCFPGTEYKISNVYSGFLRQVFKVFKYYPTS